MHLRLRALLSFFEGSLQLPIVDIVGQIVTPFLMYAQSSLLQFAVVLILHCSGIIASPVFLVGVQALQALF